MKRLTVFIPGLLLGLFLQSSGHALDMTNPDYEFGYRVAKKIYLMSEDDGWKLLDQCMRSSYKPESYWRVTAKQIESLEKMLSKEINKLSKQSDAFSPGKLEQYGRQYIGFKKEGKTFYYGNFFPTEHKLQVDPQHDAVVLCRGDKRFWGMLFNVTDFKFEAIEKNDRFVKPRGMSLPGEEDLPPPPIPRG
ncbi:hypothetical protein [Pleionea sp. CnH1-48]|uniref:hypothetical protein n=1 Tax=Pleionea sp. CnH1-48 TaxID=2954494 RepID=UPI00209714D9|nr:hypothetical protein [Pleionea sp. CnH1-48]MCO7224700.1 hypothetical protein [Pleionea sp. CnH1-48]